MKKVNKLIHKLLLISLVILGSAILVGCKSKAVITLSPEELAIALTKSAYQQGTREAIHMMTNEREAGSSVTPTPADIEGRQSETQAMTDGPGVPTDTPSTGMPPLTPTATATFQSSPVVPGLTMTPTATNALTPTRTKTPTATNALTPTRTKTATATGVKTPTPQTGWGGIWVGYLQQPDGTYISGQLIVTLSGDQVSGVFYASGIDMTLTGKLSTDGQQANGRYTYQPGEGWFLWLRETNLQFRGCIDNQFAFCAAREGVNQPDLCGYYSPY